MMRYITCAAFTLLICGNLFIRGAEAQNRETATVEAATAVLNEVMATPEHRIPHSLLNGAKGIAVIPNVVKGGFVVGARHGKGVLIVRDETGAWKPPVFVSITGGSVGWQVGVQSTDVVLVFKTQRSIKNLNKDKFTLGADIAVAAGPVGRQASAATDAKLKAEILSYSRSRGLFAGASLEGSSLQIDPRAAAQYYQTAEVTPDGVPAVTAVPPSALQLIQTISAYAQGPQDEFQPAAEPTPIERPLSPAAPLSPNVPAVAHESARQQLINASIKLQTILDANWKQYLALPAEAYEVGGQPNIDALRRTLDRYDAVAAKPIYATLAQRVEFTTTHAALKQYVEAVAGGNQIKLPPPPSPATNFFDGLPR